LEKIKASSKIYQTEALLPEGGEPQPDYLNCAILVETQLSPEAILAKLLEIEAKLGRVRDGKKWMPRTIDLDLILFEDQIINLPNLKIPHPEMTKRRFVLEPLNDIYPAWRHPVIGRTVAEMISELFTPPATTAISKLG
jgi:2-amino-4-hydroxy-6-hydroxymethyldihydropteridine diphosphokinase